MGIYPFKDAFDIFLHTDMPEQFYIDIRGLNKRSMWDKLTDEDLKNLEEYKIKFNFYRKKYLLRMKKKQLMSDF